jgi:hypothetical protein
MKRRIFTILILAAPALSQEPPPLAPVKSGLYVGAPSCGSSNCHGSVRPRKVFDVLQNEYFTWLKRDPHYLRAYRVLFEERSRAIARNLGLSAPASESKLCLDCHAMVVPQERQAKKVEIEDGIACEACHGPASGWIEGHTAEDWTYGQSMKAGMVDLRNLSTRAGLCLSCHLGDGGKSVDHELIAAGHPELVFELDNYGQGMPAHWRDVGGAAVWAVGQLAAFKEGLDLLARRARSERWPELSELSCDACHHSLAEERWRRGPTGDRPGLPRWSPARWAALRHLVAAVDSQARDALDAEVAKLARQAARFSTPPSELAATAEGLSRRLTAVLAKLAMSPFAADRLFLRLASESDVADRQSAEQIYFALRSLSADLLARNPELSRAGIPATLESMRRTLENPYDWNAGRFASQLAELKRQAEGAL